MEIVNNSIKTQMLDKLAEAIQPDTGSNFIFFTNVNGDILGNLPFDRVATEGTTGNPRLAFQMGENNYNLEGIVDKSGKVDGFYIVSGTEKVAGGTKIITGKVGIPTDTKADLKFNRSEWIKKNSIELSNATITLEN